jgi:hypothetical protein
MSIETPLIFVCVSSLIMRAIGWKPLASIGNAYCYLDKASQITIVRINADRLAWFQGLRFESRSVVD